MIANKMEKVFFRIITKTAECWESLVVGFSSVLIPRFPAVTE